MKRTFKTLLAGIMTVGMAGLFRPAHADVVAEHKHLTLRVTVSVSLAVALDDTDYDFGSIGADTVTVSTRPITATNSSGGLVEDFTINASTFIATGGTDWNINADALTVALDQYSLCMQVGTTPPTPDGSTFVADDCFDDDNATDEDMSTTLFNGTGGATDGDNVADAGTRELWFRFRSPSSITSGEGSEQTMTVTITANASSQF